MKDLVETIGELSASESIRWIGIQPSSVAHGIMQPVEAPARSDDPK